MILQLDEKRSRLESTLHPLEHGQPGPLALLEHLLRYHASHAAGQRNEPVALFGHGFPGHARCRIAGSLDLPQRHEANEIAIPLFVPRQQDQVIDGRSAPFAPFLRPRKIELASQDRRDPPLFARLVQLQGSEHVAVIGHGHRPHPELLGPPGDLPDAQGAVQKRILGMDVQVDELGSHAPRRYSITQERRSRLRSG